MKQKQQHNTHQIYAQCVGIILIYKHTHKFLIFLAAQKADE